MASQAPTPTRKESVMVNLNAPGRAHIKYMNEAFDDKTFEISTSRPDIMEPEMELLPFRRGESRMIDLKIYP